MERLEVIANKENIIRTAKRAALITGIAILSYLTYYYTQAENTNFEMEGNSALAYQGNIENYSN